MKFYHLTNFPAIPETYVQEAINAKYETRYKPNQVMAPASFNNDPMMHKIRMKLLTKYKRDVIAKGVYIKNPPYSYYDWHTDISRDCSINWVLKTNPQALTLYREHIPAPEDRRSLMYDIEVIDYTLYKPTILDTTHEHSVINPSSEERIIYSLSLSISFEEAKEFFSNVVV